MKTATWMKDVLLISVALAALAAVTAYLLTTERIDDPVLFYRDAEGILQTASEIDEAFSKVRTAEGVEQAPVADNLRIARRLALGLTGTVPSLEEIRAMEQVDPDRQIDWYLSRILGDRRTSSFLAERLTRQFVGTEEGPFLVFRRRRFTNWLAEQIHNRQRYDDIAKQLVVDSGLWTDSPAVNFYTYNIVDGGDSSRPDPIRLAARTSRAFLGMRIDCLQCHDDFLGTMNLGSVDDPVGGTQLHFHELAAFFSQTENSLMGIRDNAALDPYQYRLLDDEDESEIQPKVPFNEDLLQQQGSLRQRLANWIVDPANRPFGRAFVNRMWAIMFGRGLVDPVDDISLEGPFPQAMELLTDDFIENEFDIQRLIRVIAATEAFRSESAAEFEITEAHKNAWATFPMIRLRPDQAAGAIIQSTSLTTIDSTAHIIERLTKFGQEIEFVERYGDPGEEEFTPRGETVSQRLLMLNGNMVAERINNGLNSPVRIRNLSPDPAKAIETVYLAVLTRRPTPKENEYFLRAITDLGRNEQNRKVQDLYWTLINSMEFSWSQ